ncbi:MAG: two-component system, chemotaxis family, CheB/CheR fusion protein [Thermomicrobiales bacterium]|jgi:two-component system CheB/CheR fusion protein|nr:two-component system, chemotaxis family, CheB/CheR fusion protein [Thermomicrobiales bacterium]
MAPANRELLAANRELTDTVDRLESQSDDLRLSTASAQIATEEIETLNEELQSANEELETLNVANAELQSRAMELEDLGAAHDQEREGLAAILAGMGDAVLVVDRHGRVIRTNAAYDAIAGVYGLVQGEGDAGRLEQVLLNLLTNAINDAPGTDRIEVR